MPFGSKQQQQLEQDTVQTYMEQVPTYEIQVEPTGTDDRDRIEIVRHTRTQIMRQDSLEAMDQQDSLESKVRPADCDEHQNLDQQHNDSANSTINNDPDATTNDLNQDSFGGNGADDECDEAMTSAAALAGDQNPSKLGGTKRRSSEHVLANRTIDTHELSQEAGFVIKPDGKSNKYPLLKVYYEFGPWVGRNRKAICVRCKHTSASSQPERLIRHLRKCVALNDEDRQIAEELLLISNANKKKRPMQMNDSLDTSDDDNKSNNDISNIISLPAGGAKRLKRDHPDRKKHVDQCLVRFIICNRIPLKSVHSKEFVELVRSLDPDYRLPSRETITNTLIPGLLKI